jgi:hypothetical protein
MLNPACVQRHSSVICIVLIISKVVLRRLRSTPQIEILERGRNHISCTPSCIRNTQHHLPHVQDCLSEILLLPPSPARIAKWTSKTNTAFDPLEDAVQRVFKKILCPKCHCSFEARQSAPVCSSRITDSRLTCGFSLYRGVVE